MSALRTPVALASLIVLSACVSAPAPTDQELALIDAATSPLVPASAAEREKVDQQDLLTQAKFWGTEYEKNPNEYQASLKYAQILRSIGSVARASEVAAQALSMKPGDPELSMIYAQASLDQGKPQDAAIALARAEGAGQGDWRMLSLIGVTMDSLDEHAPAQDYYRKALALSPDNPKILANLGLSYALEGKPGLAEQTLRQAITLPGADSRVTQNLVVVLGVQGKFDEAEKIAAAEMPKALIESNRDYFRSMLNASRSWETLRGSQN
jgi:Flp pilus assembly protein TadD